MNYFEIFTKVYIGKYNIEKDFGDFKRIFIVTDKFMAESGAISYILDDIKNAEYELFTDVEPDPDISLIIKGVEKIKEFKPNAVIAFGGGSAIDACKAIVFFAKKAYNLTDCPFIAIPTTSGTGSEVTQFSVISDKEKGIKYPIIDKELLPNIAILDSNLILTVPPKITAYTGIDVITHAIEAYVSTNSNAFSDAFAEKAFNLAFSNLKLAYDKPDNKDAREAMHLASCMAGMAFDNASLGANHSLAHILGAKSHYPHGLANGILLPYIIEFNSRINEKIFDKKSQCNLKYEKLAEILSVKAFTNRQSILNLIREIKKLCNSIGIEQKICKYGFSESEFNENLEEMCEIAVLDRCTATNPCELTKIDVKNIFIQAYK